MSNHAAAYDGAIFLRQRVDTLVSELTELQSLRLRLLRAEATTVRAGLFHRQRPMWRSWAARRKP